MTNPYAAKSSDQFWRTAIAERAPRAVRPIPAKRFALADGAQVATAGSCFAQNVGKYLAQRSEVRLLQTETCASDQPLFSARFGNIYTVRQLWQLFCEAAPNAPRSSLAWRRPDGRWVDALRPAMFGAGFDSPAAVAAARAEHLAAVRRMFTDCDVLIFTLGLTEAWLAPNGSVCPIAPGVMADDPTGAAYRFYNFDYAETLADLTAFLTAFGATNPAARIVLTVSPVPLTATFTDEHVLVATSHSKAILRAVCAAAETAWEQVYYFPSYEIIAGHYNQGRYYDDNKRTVTAAGIDHVMDVFQATYFTARPADDQHRRRQAMLDQAYRGSETVICDEDLIAKSVGF